VPVHRAMVFPHTRPVISIRVRSWMAGRHSAPRSWNLVRVAFSLDWRSARHVSGRVGARHAAQSTRPVELTSVGPLPHLIASRNASLNSLMSDHAYSSARLSSYKRPDSTAIRYLDVTTTLRQRCRRQSVNCATQLAWTKQNHQGIAFVLCSSLDVGRAKRLVASV